MEFKKLAGVFTVLLCSFILPSFGNDTDNPNTNCSSSSGCLNSRCSENSDCNRTSNLYCCANLCRPNCENSYCTSDKHCGDAYQYCCVDTCRANCSGSSCLYDEQCKGGFKFCCNGECSDSTCPKPTNVNLPVKSGERSTGSSLNHSLKQRFFLLIILIFSNIVGTLIL